MSGVQLGPLDQVSYDNRNRPHAHSAAPVGTYDALSARGAYTWLLASQLDGRPLVAGTYVETP